MKQHPHMKLDKLLLATARQSHVFGAVVRVETGNNKVSWTGAAGNLEPDSPFFIASTTKLYVTACLLKLREQKRLQLTEPIGRYLSSDILAGIHLDRGTDSSNNITIEQLMAHTSGLPDYFQHRRDSGKSLIQELTAGHDQSWTFDKAIEDTKRMKPHFPPGKKGLAHYSDTNYQLLGRILETVTGKPIEEVFRQYVYEPLELSHTYLYLNPHDTTPAPLYYKRSPLHIPQAMASFGPDGGIVSTAEELLRFLRGFFEGRLFPVEYIRQLYKWNKIFFPLQYGVGISKFQLPRVFSPFKPLPELIGHSGLSGAFAFYCPEKDLYMAGTVNQISHPSTSFKLMLKFCYVI